MDVQVSTLTDLRKGSNSGVSAVVSGTELKDATKADATSSTKNMQNSTAKKESKRQQRDKKHRKAEPRSSKKRRPAPHSDSSSSSDPDEADGGSDSDESPSDSDSDSDASTSSSQSSDWGIKSRRKENQRRKATKKRHGGSKSKNSRRAALDLRDPCSNSDSGVNDDSDSDSDISLDSGADGGRKSRSVKCRELNQLAAEVRHMKLQQQMLQQMLQQASYQNNNPNNPMLVHHPGVGAGTPFLGGSQFLGSFNQLQPPPQPSSLGFPGSPIIQDPKAVLRNDPSDRRGTRSVAGGLPAGLRMPRDLFGGPADDKKKNSKHQRRRRRREGPRADFKRVDEVWDNRLHQYRLKDTAEVLHDKHYDDYVFHVRRTFDWDGRYKQTLVDIKSKVLRECLQDVMGNIKGVNLVVETPKLDPNMLFLYLDDFLVQINSLKKPKPTKSGKSERRKDKLHRERKRAELKLLVKYIKKDYAAIKSSLDLMLENGLITFDLFWALWKPGTLAFTSTYGCLDEPRAFRVEMVQKHQTFMKGEWYTVEGRYFEYDGKQFGFGSQAEELSGFQEARKINSLPVYPLKFHETEAQLRKDLIERGRKFVTLAGANYRSYKGISFFKKRRDVVKVNVNGRIMIDATIHRRVNPNYPLSLVRPREHAVDLRGLEQMDSGDEGAASGDSENGNVDMRGLLEQMAKDPRGIKTNEQAVEVVKQEAEFSDVAYLTASPIVLGFAFAEKLWLEFSVSGVRDIEWNEKAYESLVLETKTKDIVKALVESHKHHEAKSIDDVIRGKGKGLVAVLHGPPGTGKTLTAEGISELLKCPLYMVSAGELGTDPRFLEGELQKILDICHSWGAILLLDEADVFLEKRNLADIHRNALVSIFLRQLEYFQGILFLTTNRVETFDDAFQSRIHIALRYGSLTQSARKAIFKLFIERVRQIEKVSNMQLSEQDYDSLARYHLNGRQIKNTVGTAQALAVNRGERLAMVHLQQVLEVHLSFERDLKGGEGYQDAMRSYF